MNPVSNNNDQEGKTDPWVKLRHDYYGGNQLISDWTEGLSTGGISCLVLQIGQKAHDWGVYRPEG